MASTSTQGGNQGQSKGRGFASMDKDRQREIASEGGRNAHEFTSEEARRAGQQSHRAKNTTTSTTSTTTNTDNK